MLPQSHIAYTLAAYDLLQERVPALRGADYRLIALAGLGPDLIDKPLAAVYFYRRYKSAVLFAHTLLAHLTVLGLVRWRRPHWPGALATTTLAALRVGFHIPRHHRPVVVLPRHVLLAVAWLALSRLAEARQRADRHQARLLVRVHAPARAVGLGGRRTARRTVVHVAPSSVPATPAMAVSAQRTSRGVRTPQPGPFPRVSIRAAPGRRADRVGPCRVGGALRVIRQGRIEIKRRP